MHIRAFDISLTALLAYCCLGVLTFGQSAHAEVRAGGLGTRVNGKVGGSCSEGQCKISGGKDVGINRFTRLSDFDTRGSINGVLFDTGDKRNLVVGVTSLNGSFIDKNISLSSPAHLFLLSPGGFDLGSGVGFINTPQLTLSTSNRLHFAEDFFDVHSSNNQQLDQLDAYPLPGAFGLNSSPEIYPHGDSAIKLDGIDIQIDKNLLVDAVNGAVQVLNSKVSVGESEGVGGILTLTGKSVLVEGDSLLTTAAANRGGKIQLGGSWQNTDLTVRQSVQTTIASGVVLDASALLEGDGGEIVVWSDIGNPDSLTMAKGHYSARGGADGGNGGRIETSGYHLDVSGIDVNLMPFLASYSPGEWLIDPYNIEIFSSASNNTGASPNYQSTASGAILNVGDLENALNYGNVTVTTGGAGSNGDDAGNIDITASLSISEDANLLTLTAANRINIASDITRAYGGDIVLNAKTIIGTSDIDLNGGDLTVNQSGNSTYSGQINKGSGNFIKDGAGVLTLSDANTYSGDTEIRAGTLQVSGSLSDSTAVIVQSGASYELAANDTVGSISGAGDINLSAYNLTTGNTLDQLLSGVLSGTGNLTKQGTGKLELSGDNSISGRLYLNAGSLHVSNTTSLGSISNIEFDGGTLRFSVTGSDDSDGSDRYILQSGGGTIEVDDLLTLTMNGVISGSGDLTKTGDGILILEGINTFEGNAYANAGKLTVSKVSSSPSMENTTCSSGASSNRCDTSVEKAQKKLKALLDQPNQEFKSINSSSLLSGNTANSDGANDSSTVQILGSQPSSTVSVSTSLAGTRSIEGVELSLSDSFVLSNEDTSGGPSENVSSLTTNPVDASDDGNSSGAEASNPSTTEDSSELLGTTDQSKDEESSQANLSLSSDTSSVLSGNTNVILVPRTEVESRFILAEKKSSLYTSNVLNLSSSGKPPSLSNLQSFLVMMRNNIANSN